MDVIVVYLLYAIVPVSHDASQDWGRKKDAYYGADDMENMAAESDEDVLAMEEEEGRRIQAEQLAAMK